MTDEADTDSQWLVAAFYCFAQVVDVDAFASSVKQRAHELDVIGTMIVAPEGINATMAARPDNMRSLLNWIASDGRFARLNLKLSETDVRPFGKLKVKQKPEIVTMNAPGVVGDDVVGTYVEPSEWNALIASPGVVVVDTRNDYEFEMGRFENAIDPDTTTFGEFPQWARDNASLRNARAIAMYCTGGIRCEKATAFLRSQGFSNVYHLRGGIIQYLKDVPATQSQWRGKCFVFDDRDAVDEETA